jgi:hypothetical protein
MAYTITLSNGNLLTTVADDTVDNTTSIGLVGRSYIGYGTIIAENLVHMLENFADSNPPNAPLIGECWFNNSSGILMVYNGATWQTAGTGYSLPVYSTAQLPVLDSSSAGALAFASDACNAGEATGHGTGTLVYLNSNGTWLAPWSGSAPTT